jgi:myo-inositol 2-dehydrogenase / D-chiro-inositol 1-dehydrogenase
MRVLVLGVGRIGALHAAHLDADPRVERVVVFDPSEERASAVVGSCRRAEAAPSVEAALERGVDAAVVATPSEQHFDDVTGLLENEVPTFCEKPLALDLDDVRAVEERAQGRILMVGFQRRFDDAYRRLRDACADARERGFAPTLYRLASGDAQPPPAEFLARAGSLFHDMLVHDFDVLGFISDAEPLSISAQASAAGLDVEIGWGTAAAVATLSDGSVAVFAGSRRAGSGYEVSCQVTSQVGTFGIGFAPEGAPYVHLDAECASRPCSDFLERFRTAYRRELSHFLDVVEGAPLEGAGPEDMLLALALADAAESSAEAGGEPRAVGATAEPARAA